MGYSTIDDGFWTDPTVLKLTPSLKLLFFWLISNPSRHYTGLYRVHKEVAEAETGISVQLLTGLLDTLEKKGFISQDKKLALVWVKNMFRYQTGKATKLSPQQHGGLKKHLTAGNLHNSKLISLFCQHYEYLGVPQLGPYTPIDTPIIGVSPPHDHTPYVNGSGKNESLILANNIGAEPPYIEDSLKDHNLAPTGHPQFSSRDLIALYNDLNPQGAKKTTLVTDKRMEKARVRLQVFPDRDFWLTVFTNVKNSGFLRCANGNRWNGGRGADLDWLLLNDQNPAKVWEGKYDEQDKPAPGGGAPSPYASRTRTIKT